MILQPSLFFCLFVYIFGMELLHPDTTSEHKAALLLPNVSSAVRSSPLFLFLLLHAAASLAISSVCIWVHHQIL